MESVHCNWRNVSQANQISKRSRPMSETLSKLAQLITCMEYKPKSQTSSSICKDASQKPSEMNALVRHQQKERTLQKLHSCQRCNQQFALLSSLQLHKCPRSLSVCQTCMGKMPKGSSCASCGSKTSVPDSTEDPIHQDNSTYACTPCGQAFTHKQDLLHHQQAGDCQPANTLKPASLPPFKPKAISTCTLCSRTFRAPRGLACHMRFSHAPRKRSTNLEKDVHLGIIGGDKSISSTLFQCRSCDKSFSKTSLLHRHRKEEHRRDVKVRNTFRNSVKITRQKRKSGIYPCLHCGTEFLHHLTRLAHFRKYTVHHEMHLKLSNKSTRVYATAAKQKLKPARKLQKDKPAGKKGRPKKLLPVQIEEIEEEDEIEEDKLEDDSDDDDEEEDEDAEFPCTSCDQVFSSKAALFVHEKVHEQLPEEVEDEPAKTCRCCSVCSDEIPHHMLTEDGCEGEVYHCVPCAETFKALDTFLEHCQKHLIREHEDEFSDD
ncbi:zinc finger protein 135 isoform X2 [Danio aesculapii]|nr:zinc finger protein 135 isoform X2 [Danio aesculapii]